jgi:hypothetical protein
LLLAVAEYRNVGVNTHKETNGEDSVGVLLESVVAAEDFQPTGSSNKREQHCACNTLEICVATIDDIDGCWYGSGLEIPGDNSILHFQSLIPSDS